MVEAAIFVIFPFCMVFAAVSDLLSMTIANRVSVILIAAFAVLAPLTGMDWTTYAWHFAAGGVVLAVTFGVFAIGGMGGGDAKLMTATSVWMGFGFLLMDYLVMTAFIGGLLTLLILLFRKSPLAMIHGQNLFLRHLSDAKTGIPYGIALGAAGLIVFPKSPLAAAALQSLAAN
ncbi:A24 family peptidase [Arvimicrobium flavum]|uniref:A24 family peptidase n=1 Tax=Arvimicrobium flavum TaxID=3393320 RepID=UPI00237AEF93|nr:prepilin peptidase [Mesorhizobium shangrilense]